MGGSWTPWRPGRSYGGSFLAVWVMRGALEFLGALRMTQREFTGLGNMYAVPGLLPGLLTMWFNVVTI